MYRVCYSKTLNLCNDDIFSKNIHMNCRKKSIWISLADNNAYLVFLYHLSN